MVSALASFVRRFRSDRRGAVSVIVAVCSIVLVGFAALAVDVGSVFLESRRLQGVADLAAMAAAGDLTHAQAAAQATADANNSGLTALATLGAYSSDPSVPAKKRFTAGATPANAVQVRIKGKADLFFAQVLLGKPTMDVSRTATSVRAELAAFSIGSRLASLQGGVANEVLGALAGGKVSLSVMDYNALAAANIDLLSYSQALQTSANLTGASFDKTLETDIGTGKALSVMADVLDGGGSVSAAAAVRKIAAAAGNSTPIGLDRLLDLGPYGAQDHMGGGSDSSVKIGAMDLATALLTLSQDGRQVKLDLGAQAPGLTDLNVWLAIGERPNNSPWLTVDRDGGVTVRTAQTRLYIEAKALSGLGVAGVQPIRLPLYLEAASAEAKLANIECPQTAADQAASLSVRPGLGEMVIGDIDPTKLNDFKTAITPGPAKIVDLGAVKVTGAADVKIGGLTWTNVRFTRADIQGGSVKTVSTQDIAKASVSSLLGTLKLDVSVLGLGLGVGPITSAVSGTLNGVAAPLDGVINTVTGLVGLQLGQADVRVNGLRCRGAALIA